VTSPPFCPSFDRSCLPPLRCAREARGAPGAAARALVESHSTTHRPRLTIGKGFAWFARWYCAPFQTRCAVGSPFFPVDPSWRSTPSPSDELARRLFGVIELHRKVLLRGTSHLSPSSSSSHQLVRMQIDVPSELCSCGTAKAWPIWMQMCTPKCQTTKYLSLKTVRSAAFALT
jgi:hypothetical protein